MPVPPIRFPSAQPQQLPIPRIYGGGLLGRALGMEPLGGLLQQVGTVIRGPNRWFRGEVAQEGLLGPMGGGGGIRGLQNQPGAKTMGDVLKEVRGAAPKLPDVSIKYDKNGYSVRVENSFVKARSLEEARELGRYMQAEKAGIPYKGPVEKVPFEKPPSVEAQAIDAYKKAQKTGKNEGFRGMMSERERYGQALLKQKFDKMIEQEKRSMDKQLEQWVKEGKAYKLKHPKTGEEIIVTIPED